MKETRLATIISLLALIVSMATGYYSCSANKDVAKSQAIRESYETFNELTRLQVEHWQLSHMFALPDRYDEVKKQVAASLTSLTPAKQSELKLKEQAIADLIFTIFEQAFYQWNHAKQVRDTQRFTFLQEVLNYFTGRLLRNPRLLYYWSEGGLSISYEAQTRAYHESHVLQDASLPVVHSPDATGPFSTPGPATPSPSPKVKGGRTNQK